MPQIPNAPKNLICTSHKEQRNGQSSNQVNVPNVVEFSYFDAAKDSEP